MSKEFEIYIESSMSLEKFVVSKILRLGSQSENRLEECSINDSIYSQT